MNITVFVNYDTESMLVCIVSGIYLYSLKKLLLSKYACKLSKKVDLNLPVLRNVGMYF